MYIVGTAGHIDHGKTSLILALTGTDCDRLPEEKERAMTIDIGFASIEYPRFGTVSIIDVPGHERFIRNMVAGAWGVDLGLLVVAADDGWMPQTEDHFRVFSLLGIERIIAVINKIDLVDEEMAAFVDEEIREKLQDTRFHDAEIIRVSSKSGNGIDALREAIVDNLRKLKKVSDTGKPYLFVDRVFASKGHGTVITGTLKNGAFHEEETVYIAPAQKEARIKKIESHYKELHEGTPSQRTALNLSGISVSDLGRGSIICHENFFTRSSDIIVSLQLLDSNKEIKNNLGIEILVGTASLKGKLILFNENPEDRSQRTVRIRFEKNWFFYPGQLFIVTSPGGYRILGGGMVLLPDYSNRTMKSRVREHLSVIQKGDTRELLEFMFRVKRYAPAAEIMSIFPLKRKALEKILNSLAEDKTLLRTGDYFLINDFYDHARTALVETVDNHVGPNMKEISDITGIDINLCKILLPDIMQSHSIIEKEGRYFNGKDITEDLLPEDKKKLLSDIYRRGGAGIELDKLKTEKEKKETGELIKMGFLISLDGNIIYHKKIYDERTEKIMSLFDSLEKISVAEAKDAADLSRKYIIPLLNRIERDGLVKRVGDFRIKA